MFPPSKMTDTVSIFLFGHAFQVTREAGVVIRIDALEGNAPHDPELERAFRGWLEGDQTEAPPFPFELRGSPFQTRVLTTLLGTPKGALITYQGLAQELGSKRYTRAVARALATNPLPFLYPCHRVVKTGSLRSGYRFGVDLKLEIIQIEAQGQ